MGSQIIFLNGASSSGKSTLARALQRSLPEPFVYLAEDLFFSALPQRPYTQEEFLRYGSRLYNGFIHAVRALYDCENPVIVDTVAWVPGSLAGFVDALWDTSVFAVGVHCPLAVLEQREQARKDRSIGLARKQWEAVHRDALYDLEIDSSQWDADAAARLIGDSLANPPMPHAFARMKRRQQSPDARAV